MLVLGTWVSSPKGGALYLAGMIAGVGVVRLCAVGVCSAGVVTAAAASAGVHPGENSVSASSSGFLRMRVPPSE